MMLDIRDHGGSFGGGIRKGQRIPFHKLTAQQPTLRWSQQLGDVSASQAWGGFFFDKDKQSVFWIFNNSGHQWREYKVYGQSNKFGGGIIVTPTTPGGAVSSLSSSQVARVIKYNGKYFVFYTSGLLVVDASTMKIISEHSGTNYRIYTHTNLRRVGNYAYYNIQSVLMRIELDNPGTAPVVISGNATNRPAVVDAAGQFFYRLSGSSLVKCDISNTTIYSKLISSGSGEQFADSLRTIAIHPNGNVIVLTTLSGRAHVALVDHTTGNVISRYTFTDLNFIGATYSSLGVFATKNHIVIAGYNDVAILDLACNLLWFGDKQAPNEANMEVCDEYLMWTWTRYINVSTYSNLFYELETLI